MHRTVTGALHRIVIGAMHRIVIGAAAGSWYHYKELPDSTKCKQLLQLGEKILTAVYWTVHHCHN